MEVVLGVILIAAIAVPVSYLGAAAATAVGRAAPALRWSGAALAAGQVVAAGYLWSLDRRLAADLVLLSLPPLVAAVALAPPGRRGPRGEAPWRRCAASGAAVLHGYVTLDPPGPPFAGDVALVLAALAVAVGVPWLWWRAVRHRLPRLPRTGLVAVSTVALVAGWFAVSSSASRIPADGSMAGHGPVDLGGGPAHPLGRSGPHGTHTGAAVDIRTLAGPRNREPDVRVSLTARTARLTLASGERFDAWTFDGTSPGPELRVRQGDLLEVTLVNADIPAGVTLHWHGLDVPNAEDGVAGLTQDAVHPGRRHVYRFVAEQVGSYWYHSHQQSDEQVRRGLFGALVVEPAIPVAGEDLVVLAHAWPTDHGRTTGLAVTGHAATSGVVRRRTAPGTRVRLRLVNADNEPRGYAVTGTSFRVTAIDGSDLPGPPEVTGRQVLVGGGGRYDVEFTMPSGPVGLTLTRDDNAGTGTSAALVLSRDGAGEPPPPGDADVLDPARYGTSGDAVRRRFTGAYDRRFTLLLGESFTFFDGRFGQYPTVNGRLHPGTPPLSVRRGDLVRVTLLSRSFEDHPMHLHGHHMLVLSRNGRPATGSPWWTDTLNVAPGERYDVAFRADNPGLWMDHCHNLDHAADGMTLHLEYQGYRTPFRVGPATGNTPE